MHTRKLVSKTAPNIGTELIIHWVLTISFPMSRLGHSQINILVISDNKDSENS